MYDSLPPHIRAIHYDASRFGSHCRNRVRATMRLRLGPSRGMGTFQTSQFITPRHSEHREESARPRGNITFVALDIIPAGGSDFTSFRTKNRLEGTPWFDWAMRVLSWLKKTPAGIWSQNYLTINLCRRGSGNLSRYSQTRGLPSRWRPRRSTLPHTNNPEQRYYENDSSARFRGGHLSGCHLRKCPGLVGLQC